MNVFFISPGRTGTRTISEAFKVLPGFSTGHESRVSMLGAERVNFPESHVECDNRLIWFMPKLTARYGDDAILVMVTRDPEKIAASYNRRWGRIHIMKAYSQGILLRKLNENTIDVCRDYVSNAMQLLNYFRKDWKNTVELDIDNPAEGLRELLSMMQQESHFETILSSLASLSLNRHESTLVRKLRIALYNFKLLIFDLRRS